MTKRGRPPFAFAAFVPASAPARLPLAIRPVTIELPPPPGWVGSAFHITGTSDLTVLLTTRIARDGASGGPGAVWGTAGIRTDARVCAVRGGTVAALIEGHGAEVAPALASAVHLPQAHSSA